MLYNGHHRGSSKQFWWTISPKTIYVIYYLRWKSKAKSLSLFRIWTGMKHILQKNIFGLNCEDWDNMVFFLSVVLGIDLSSHNFEERKLCWIMAGGVITNVWQPCYRKQPYQSRQAKSEWGNSNYTVSHKNVFRHFSFNHLSFKHLKGSDRELILWQWP